MHVDQLSPPTTQLKGGEKTTISESRLAFLCDMRLVRCT